MTFDVGGRELAEQFLKRFIAERAPGGCHREVSSYTYAEVLELLDAYRAELTGTATLPADLRFFAQQLANRPGESTPWARGLVRLLRKAAARIEQLEGGK